MQVDPVLIEAVALRKSYGARLALDGVSMAVRRGEVLGLLGPNGAGKTTTLSILATLLRPDAGEVRIGDVAAGVAVRRKLGLVPQSLALYRSLTGRQNLELFARLHGIRQPEARAVSTRALEEVGLAERAQDPVATLSGGMQRRLNLACGIVHRPEVLLLDEPAVGVDPQAREQILLTVRKSASAGAAVIYSTHYMEEIENVCDRVLLIDHGRVLAEGTVAELITRGGQHHILEIAFRQHPNAGWHHDMPGLIELSPLSDDVRRTFQLANLAQVGEVLDKARAAGAQVLEFSVHSPNLSDAFMALTGRALRDP
ncbi:MAG TPA: ABC transporter ATP-binding protein [Candidatus Binataceae bacterium]|nr:ABC transporter ATP-binding protein [Candidatus Binataceae bacterium]